MSNSKIWIIGEMSGGVLEPLLTSKSIQKSEMTDITISALITSILNTSDNPFREPPIFTMPSGYTNLSAINVDSKNPYYSSIEGVLFNRSATTLIRCPPAYPLINIVGLSTFKVPGDQNQQYTHITKIDDHAFFMNYRIQNIDLTNMPNIHTIGKYAFDACSITGELGLANNIRILDEGCFKDNNQLIRVKWYVPESPASLETINNIAFYNCFKLQVFPFYNCPNLTIIDDRAFIACFGLTEIDIGDCTRLHTIGISAFHDTTNNPEKHVESIIFPPSEKHVESIIFPPSILSIGESAFENNYVLASIAFREGTDFGALSLGDNCFKAISRNVVIFKSSADISTNILSDRMIGTSITTDIHYIDTDIYSVDVIKLSEFYISGHGLLHPNDFTYQGIFTPPPDGFFSTIFSSDTARTNFLNGYEITTEDLSSGLHNTQETIYNILDSPLSVPGDSYNIDITQINNLTGFTSNLIDYGRDYVLMRYRRGIYIPRNSTNISKFKYKISVDDKALVLLYKPGNPEKIEYNLHSNTTTSIEGTFVSPAGNNAIYELPVESNQYYILIVIAYEYTEWQHLSFRPVL